MTNEINPLVEKLIEEINDCRGKNGLKGRIKCLFHNPFFFYYRFRDLILNLFYFLKNSWKFRAFLSTYRYYNFDDYLTITRQILEDQLTDYQNNKRFYITPKDKLHFKRLCVLPRWLEFIQSNLDYLTNAEYRKVNKTKSLFFYHLNKMFWWLLW